MTFTINITIPSGFKASLKSTKEKLMQCEYFKSLFMDIDDIGDTIDVDLSKFGFDDIYHQVHLLFTCINDDMNFHFTVDNYMLKLIAVCDFFGADFMYRKIDAGIEKYINDICRYIIKDKKKLYDKFIEDIVDIYDIFKMRGKMDKFRMICDIINMYDTDMIINLDIHVVPIYKCYDIFKSIPNKCPKKAYEIFEYYNELEYTKLYNTEYQHKLYNIVAQTFGDIVIEPKTNYGTNSVLSYGEFMDNFNKHTDNIFDGIDWNNMVIAGGFIFGLLNNVSNSIIPSTDIDIFVYSKDENVRKDKWYYLMEFFSKLKPVYVNKQGIVNIISPIFKYNIQIIMVNEGTPYDIINSFDLNYVKLYYDGFNVNASIDCMFGCKYQIAICECIHYHKFNFRLFKTILKGLNIMLNNEIDQHCKLFDKDKNLDIKMMNALGFYNDVYYDDIRKKFEDCGWDLVEGVYDNCMLTMDHTKIEWDNVCDAFVSYVGERVNKCMLLNESNVDIKKELHKNDYTNKFNICKGYSHSINDKHVDIFIEIKYDFLKFIDKTEYAKNVLHIYPNKETVNLLKNYGMSIGIDTFDKYDENYNDVSDKCRAMREHMNKKFKIIKIKFNETNVDDKKCIDKFLKYYDMNHMTYQSNINYDLINIICSITWLKRGNMWYIKLCPSKMTFNM